MFEQRPEVQKKKYVFYSNEKNVFFDATVVLRYDTTGLDILATEVVIMERNKAISHDRS